MSVVICICYTFTCSFHRHCVFTSLHPMFAGSKIHIWELPKLPLSVWNNRFISWCCCLVVLSFSGLGLLQQDLWRLARDQQSQFSSSGFMTEQMSSLTATFCFCRPFVTFIKKKDWRLSSGYFLPDTLKNNLFKWKLNNIDETLSETEKNIKASKTPWSALYYKSSDRSALWEMQACWITFQPFPCLWKLLKFCKWSKTKSLDKIIGCICLI